MPFVREIPHKKSDGEIAFRPIETLDWENEPALEFILEKTVTYALVVVRVDILEL